MVKKKIERKREEMTQDLDLSNLPKGTKVQLKTTNEKGFVFWSVPLDAEAIEILEPPPQKAVSKLEELRAQLVPAPHANVKFDTFCAFLDILIAQERGGADE